MKSIRVVAAFACAAMLLGCAGREVDSNFKPDMDPKRGYVAISLMVSGTIQSRSVVEFWWRPGKGERERSVQWSSNVRKLDWPFLLGRPTPREKPAGRLVILEIPPGQYEFHRFSATYGGYIHRNRDPFSAKFEVVPGKVTYAGSLHVHVDDNQVNVSAEDQRERDLALLAKKFINVPPDQVAVRPIKEVERPNP